MIINSPNTVALLCSRVNTGLLEQAISEATNGLNQYPQGVRTVAALIARGFRPVHYLAEELEEYIKLFRDDRGVEIPFHVAVRASELLPEWYHSLFDALCVEEQENPWTDFDTLAPHKGMWARP